MKKILALALAVIFLLSACQGGVETKGVRKGTKDDPILVGVVGSQNEVWEDIIARLENEGVFVELVVFTDYNTPNDSLNSGDIDLNAFQHKAFLKSYNDANNTNLISIGDTILAPLGVYSKKITDINDFPEGGTIAIPNDETNNARSLRLLEGAGLITFPADLEGNPTLQDILDNPKNITIEELDASQTPRALDDADAAIINDDMSVDAGLQASKDAIYIEPMSEASAPYVNILCAKEENKDNETLKKIVQAYQSDETAKVIDEFYKGSRIPAWD